MADLRQDWEPVVVRKKAPTSSAKKDEKAVNAARRAGAELETIKKCTILESVLLFPSARAFFGGFSLFYPTKILFVDYSCKDQLKSLLVFAFKWSLLPLRMTQGFSMILYKDPLNLSLRNLIVCMSLCAVNAGSNKAATSATGLNTKRLDDETDVLAR